jgi:hypothetical protein
VRSSSQATRSPEPAPGQATRRPRIVDSTQREGEQFGRARFDSADRLTAAEAHGPWTPDMGGDARTAAVTRAVIDSLAPSHRSIVPVVS